ncbi:heterokaryon incompatibility protein-domain-containing protein [Daldinia eschscholtzii]|nr:heterokaryon incompatibility protein-domain-containing protein [Daldinia eschscholtzii]
MNFTLRIYTSLRNAVIYASQLIHLTRKAKDYRAGTSTSPLNPHEAIYTPLSQNQVRFIEILPSDTEEGPVRCLLKAVELGPDVRYAALSYIWGDPGVTRDIIVNDIVLPVTVNLESALRQFSKTGFPGKRETGLITQLWVDAVCVNQQDIPERNHQVTMMASIYSNATAVFSWLGPPGEGRHDLALRAIRETMFGICDALEGAPDSSLVWSEMVKAGFEWMTANLGDITLDSTGHESVHWKALINLRRNEYWSRMWVIQEIALVRNQGEHWFICGAESVPQPIFMNFRLLLLHCRGPKPPNIHVRNANEALVWDFLSDNRLSGLPLFDLVWTFWKKIDFDERHLVDKMSQFALRASATNPRDFVYAIIGLMPNTIKPDYSKPVNDVYLDAVMNDGIAQCFLPCLEYSGCGYDYINNYNVPSWLPDFSKLHTNSMLVPNKKHLFLYDLELQPPEISQRSTLRIQGVTYGRVKLVKPLNFRDTDDSSSMKYIHRICIEYLADFTDLGSYESNEDRLSWARINHPLRSLLDVLTSELEDDQVVTIGHQNHGISTRLNLLTEEEKLAAMERLGVQREISLDELLANSLIDMTDGDFWVRLRETPKVIGERARLDYKAMALRVRNMALFQTDKGQLGIGPPNLQVGDTVCALDKCTFSSLLRKDGSRFQHVGICYVTGLSSMNPADMIEKGEMQVETFEID